VAEGETSKADPLFVEVREEGGGGVPNVRKKKGGWSLLRCVWRSLCVCRVCTSAIAVLLLEEERAEREERDKRERGRSTKAERREREK
jgi:hypothetical protein